jgi:hypothetical protein
MGITRAYASEPKRRARTCRSWGCLNIGTNVAQHVRMDRHVVYTMSAS